MKTPTKVLHSIRDVFARSGCITTLKAVIRCHVTATNVNTYQHYICSPHTAVKRSLDCRFYQTQRLLLDFILECELCPDFISDMSKILPRLEVPHEFNYVGTCFSHVCQSFVIHASMLFCVLDPGFDVLATEMFSLDLEQRAEVVIPWKNRCSQSLFCES